MKIHSLQQPPHDGAFPLGKDVLLMFGAVNFCFYPQNILMLNQTALPRPYCGTTYDVNEKQHYLLLLHAKNIGTLPALDALSLHYKNHEEVRFTQKMGAAGLATFLKHYAQMSAKDKCQLFTLLAAEARAHHNPGLNALLARLQPLLKQGQLRHGYAAMLTGNLLYLEGSYSHSLPQEAEILLLCGQQLHTARLRIRAVSGVASASRLVNSNGLLRRFDSWRNSIECDSRPRGDFRYAKID